MIPRGGETPSQRINITKQFWAHHAIQHRPERRLRCGSSQDSNKYLKEVVTI